MDDLTDTQRRFLHLTRRYKRINRRADRWMREHPSAAEWPEDLRRESEQVASKIRAMRDGGELPDELKAVCRDGTPRWELLKQAGEQMELEVV